MAAAFEELGVMPELIKAVEELGWTLPTPVQVEAVPLILGGGDVMAAAETGSGKTGAFALPVLQIVHEALTGIARTAAVASAAAAHAGEEGSGRRCELSVDDRDAFFSIRDGVRCQCRQERNWGGARATLGAFGGRVYYEAEVCDEGLCRVGWSTMAGSYDIGTDRQSFGYGGTGKKSHGRQFDSYGEEYTKGDVVGCLLDTVGGSISFSKNGNVFGPAFQIPQHLQGQVLYPALTLKNAEMVVNFGDTPFKFGPPQGFVGLSKAPADITVSAAAAATAAAAGSSSSERKPLCLVLEPSRDLAEQTHKCFQAYGKHLAAPALSSVLLVGGVDAGPQFRALKEGAEIVVGTPGRVMDFVESGKLPLDKIRFFVLDEADRLLDSEDVIMKLFRRLNKGGAGLARLQVLMFSATLHSAEVKRLAAAICQQPMLVDLKGKDAVPDTVDHVLLRVDPTGDATWLQSTPKAYTDNIHVHDPIGPNVTTPEAMSQAVKILKQRLLKRVLDTHNMDQCLIFCRTNFDCDNLEKFLLGLSGDGSSSSSSAGKFRGKREGGKEHPYSCVVLAGQRTMDERRAALQAFKDGDVRFMICTDVAARGIDISGLPYVINMTLPDKSEDYIHRVGRVGRADHMGLAISLVASVPEKVWFCTVKGYKPWLEPDAKNTKLQEQGGHTIWYDEPGLLQEVEKRLGSSIPSLAEDLSLPPELQARLAGEGSTYGQARGGGGGAELSERLQSIRQNVEALVALEWQAQTSFLTLKSRWTGGGGAGSGGGGGVAPMEA